MLPALLPKHEIGRKQPAVEFFREGRTTVRNIFTGEPVITAVTLVVLGANLLSCSPSARPTLSSTMPPTSNPGDTLIIGATSTGNTPYPSETPTATSTVIPATAASPVRVYRNLVYALPLQEGVFERKLDIYTPKKVGDWPVVLFMHGGIGSKENLVGISQELAEQGMIVFTINWPPGGLKAAYQDNGRKARETYEVLACAVQFAKSAAPGYGGDPSEIVVVGFSMGADYGSWFTLAGEELEKEWDIFSDSHGGPPPQVKCVGKKISGAADAFVGIGGIYTYANNLREKHFELWKLFSPFAQIGKNTGVPLRFLHGKRDDFGPDLPAELNDLLVSAGYDTDLVIFDGGHEVPIELTAELVSELVGD